MIRGKTIEYIRGRFNVSMAQQPFAKRNGLAVSRVQRFFTSKESITPSEKFLSRFIGVSSCFLLAVVTANAEEHDSDNTGNVSVGAQSTTSPEDSPDPAVANVDSAPQDQAEQPVTQVLSSKPDLYSGLAINPSDLPSSPVEFQQRLAASLEAWKAQGKRGIWLTLPSSLVELVPVAVKMG